MSHVPLFSLLMPVLLAGLLAGCSREADPDSPEGKRQAAFKQLLSHSEPMAGMLNGRIAFDPEAFAVHALALDEKAEAPWHFFPDPANSDQPTAVRESVWSDADGFAERIEQFQTATARLAEAAREGVDSPEDVREPLQAVQQACKACHDGYRR
ncbi:cytochrome c [Halopseudomonas nanhaiensis]|uniref:c-type cytochrome n=1 Tax=Halopseudomonas nanhaiensis TaxID=2830842 RepID=UPI001CBBC00F|nr:cytochrome c [Halopseudomonas nanhaiensis]UAW98795.1 cytochrome c [Halopseudomonas nanhaiensis]